MTIIKPLTFAVLVAGSAAAAAAPRTETAVLAGGCFWGMEAVFEHVKGVIMIASVLSGPATPKP
jgi:peptide-methionine (S)-S-oxide reductase